MGQRRNHHSDAISKNIASFSTANVNGGSYDLFSLSPMGSDDAASIQRQASQNERISAGSSLRMSTVRHRQLGCNAAIHQRADHISTYENFYNYNCILSHHFWKYHRSRHSPVELKMPIFV